MSLCMNCRTHGADDMEVISNLIKIRLKPKVLLNHYMLCVRYPVLNLQHCVCMHFCSSAVLSVYNTQTLIFILCFKGSC